MSSPVFFSCPTCGSSRVADRRPGWAAELVHGGGLRPRRGRPRWWMSPSSSHYVTARRRLVPRAVQLRVFVTINQYRGRKHSRTPTTRPHTTTTEQQPTTTHRAAAHHHQRSHPHSQRPCGASSSKGS